MNQRQIEVFHAVMTNGTASRAAEVLRISQPAVSKAVQELERSIGFPLFDRVKSRMLPTAEAQLLHREVEASFISMGHLRSAAARIRDFGSGEIRIACLSALSTNIVPRALRAFQEAHPNVAITLQARMSSVVRDLVAEGQFDVGLAADEIDLTGVDASPFATHKACIALYEGHPLEHLDVIRPEDLHDRPFIALAPEDTTRREAEFIFEKSGGTPRTVIETPYSTTICAMVSARLGCGLVNPLTAEPYLNAGLILKPFEPSIYFRTLLLLPPNRRPSRLLKELVDALRKHSSAKPSIM